MAPALCEPQLGRLDADLVIAAAAGNREAFTEIYDRYANRLFDFCVGMLVDFDAAAECMQDVFCTAATRLPQLDEPEKLRTWLYAIAYAKAFHRIRDYGRELPTAERLPATSSVTPGPGNPGPGNPVAGTQLNYLIADTGGLSAQDRAVLQLAYRHGLDGPDLAAALGVTTAAATAVLHRLGDTIRLRHSRP